ncbi:MAG: transporter substrate-binding domain-containing protein [Alphaproteobacteria bacterium]|nr:transporter substrate-binding domain-containing protein [Alphaproteobacteria bacterium]
MMICTIGSAAPKAASKTDTDSGVLMPDLMHFVKRGKIVVAIYTEDNPPFYYRTETGETQGVDVEIARRIAQSIDPNIQVEITRTPQTFNDVIDVVSKGQADIGISMLSYTSQRSRKVLYTNEPYIVLHTALFIDQYALSKSGSHSSLKDLFNQDSHRKLCVIQGSSYEEVAKNLLPHAQLVRVHASSDLLPSLEQGKCFAFLEDDQAIKKRLIKNPRLNLRYKMVVLRSAPDPIHIVVSAAFPQLLHHINNLLRHEKNLQINLDTIVQKYAHTFLKE